MKQFALTAAAAIALAFCAPPATLAANPDPTAVQAGVYNVEPLHTRVLFSVNHLGFNDYFGQFSRVSGTLKLDPRDAGSSLLDVTVPVASIDTTNAKLDGELSGADWFNAEQFPVIHFVSTEVKPTGANTARVVGNLTLHGVTKPVALDVTFNASGPNPLTKAFTAGFSAHGQIKRSDFGVSKYVPFVGDDVTLIISAAFEKQPN